MKLRPPSVRPRDPHTLAGPYALDALGEQDRARFERHLSRCDSCRAEARGLREATARLAAAAVVTPDPAMRGRVLAAAARTRQLPPEGRSLAPGRLAARGFGVPRLAVAVACGLVVIALALGGLVLSAQHRLGADQARAGQIAAVLNAPDVTMLTAKAVAGGTATVVMSHHYRALVLTTARLPALPASQGYQLWLMGPRGVRPAGMLPAPHHGMTPPVIVSGLAAGDKVGVTVEPAGGMSHPTSAPVLLMSLSS